MVCNASGMHLQNGGLRRSGSCNLAGVSQVRNSGGGVIRRESLMLYRTRACFSVYFVVGISASRSLKCKPFNKAHLPAIKQFPTTSSLEG